MRMQLWISLRKSGRHSWHWQFIRHKYDDLDTRIIADVLQGKLAALRMVALAAQQRLSTGGP